MISRHSVRVKAGGTKTFGLDRAILIYSDQHSMNGGNPRNFAMLHEIERNRIGGAHLAAGTPISASGCKAFVRSLTDLASFDGWLTPTMLYTSPRVTAWWRPPCRERVWFRTTDAPEGDQVKVDIGERSAVTPHPGLVFALAGGEWHVYAVTGADRPQQQTQLHVAPYFNVWEDGHICEGNVKRPAKVTPETIAAFERAFFGSRFTHPNTGRLVNFKGGAGKFWTALLDGRWKKFPEQYLVRMKRTLADQLRTLEKGD
jgi:PRTRC genetic system protein B